MADKSGAIDDEDDPRLIIDSAIIQDEVESIEADPTSLRVVGSDRWRLPIVGLLGGSECGATPLGEREPREGALGGELVNRESAR